METGRLSIKKIRCLEKIRQSEEAMISRQEELIVALKKKYSYGYKKKSNNVNPSEDLQTLLESCTQEKILLQELADELYHYAHENLNRIGESDNYTIEETNDGLSRIVVPQKKATKSARAVAVNLLLEMLKTSSAYEVYQYVATPYFQQIVGAKEYKFNFLRMHLSKVVDKFIYKYQEFLKINNTDLLLDVLLNKDVYNTIGPVSIAKLFWYYHPKIVADVVVNFYQDDKFVCNDIPDVGCRLNYEMMKSLLADNRETLEYVNLNRSKLKAQTLLPLNCRSPGVNQLTDQGLTKYQLYQYDELTVFAVEQWLRSQFSRLFINNIKTGGALVIKSLIAPYFFYQIPAARYMLLDPEDAGNAFYYRFRDFQKDIPQLIMSNDDALSKWGKPVIFCGIINIGTAHYIPYFIYKNTQGKIQVITVDPSPRTHPREMLDRHGEYLDSKLKTFKKITKIFASVFPGCEVYDPDVNQMLRERDCGPNSATTLLDALESCEGDQPLLQIVHNGVDDRLEINSGRLTSHYTNVGVNPYTNIFVYSDRLEADSLANRARWQERLMQVKEVRTLTERTSAAGQNPERPQSVYDEYDINVQIMEDYNYVQLVESQQQQDSRAENISAVHSMLLGAPEGQALINRLIEQYKATLVLPEPRMLVDFIKSKVTTQVQQEVLASAHTSLENLAEDVITVLLREHIPAALSSVFISNVLGNLPHSPDLRAETVVKQFLEHDFGSIFAKLPIHQQRMLTHELQEYAERAIEKELIAVYSEIIFTLLQQSGRDYLSQLKMEANGLTIEQLLANHIYMTHRGAGKINEALQFLKIHAESNLLSRLHRYLAETQERVVEDSVGHVIHTLNLRQKRLVDILAFITRDTGQFIPLDAAALKTHLKKFAGEQIHPYVLSAMEVDGYLGQVVLAEINRRLFQEVKDYVGTIVKESIERFFMIPAIQQEITANQGIMSLTSMLDEQGKLMPAMQGAINLNYLMERYGSQSTLTMHDYSHMLVSQYAGLYIEQGIAKIILNALHEHYKMLADAIVNVNAEKLQYRHINSQCDLADMHGMAYSFYISYMQSNIQAYNFFTQTFLSAPLAANGPISQNPYADFNLIGIRFHHWFMSKVCDVITKNNRRARQLADNITNASQHVSYMQHIIYTTKLLDEKTQQNTIVQLNTHVSRLGVMLKKLDAISMGEEFTAAYDKLNVEVLVEIQQVCSFVTNACYSFAMIKPGSVTTKLRPALCCLLDIDAPHITTYSEAYRIDRDIMNKCQNFNEVAVYHVRKDQNVYVLEPMAALPNAYGKPVTRELLLQCISFWFTQSSISYSLLRPSLWFANDHLPEFIHKLIDIVNGLPNDQAAADVLAAEQIQHLKSYVLLSENSENLSIFASTDMVDRIKAVLAKTTTLMNATSTPLRFADLSEFLSLREAAAKQAAQRAPVISEPYIQSKLMEKIRKARADNPSAALDLAKLRQEIINEAGGSAGVEQQKAAYIDDMPNVRAVDLVRTGMQSWGIFGGGLTQIEKDLLDIKRKHGNDQAFNLDEDDVEKLRRRLQERWRKLVMDFGSFEAAKHYIEHPDRKDKVYIAVADILTNYYHSKGMVIFNFNLLMPEYARYPDASKLREYTLPKSICIAYQVEQQDTSIAGIPLANLVITRSGYALDIDWIITRYQKDQKLINPYTEVELTISELDDVCRNAKSKVLLEHVWSNCTNGISERGLALLVEYLNNAIYSNGFSSNYSNRQNDTAHQAYTKMGIGLVKLPAKEQEAFWNETIPCSELKTIRSVFEERDNCLTQNGIFLARVVFAYRGEAHGLTNKDLVRLSNDREIPHREFISVAKVRNPLERHLYEKMMAKTSLREGLKLRV